LRKCYLVKSRLREGRHAEAPHGPVTCGFTVTGGLCLGT